MDCKQALDLKLYFKKQEFFVDDIINGTLLLESERPSIVEKIVFEINMLQEYKIEGNAPAKYTENICTFDLDLNKGKTLSPIQNCYVMPGGKNMIPFNFKFSNELLPCFEFPLSDKHAFLRYQFKVKVYSSSFDKLLWNHFLFLKARPVANVNNESLSKTIDRNIKKMGLIAKGTTVMKVTIPENNFKVDGTLKVNINIDNQYGKEPTKEAKVKYTRIIDFYGKKQDIKFSDEVVIFEKKVKTEVLAGKQSNYDCEFPVRESNVSRYVYNKKNINPYDLDLKEINYYMPTIFCKLFSCKYELRVTLYFKDFVKYNDRPRARFPINLVHQSLAEYQTEIQEKIEQEKKEKEEKEKQEKESNEIIEDKKEENNINNNEEKENEDEEKEEEEIKTNNKRFMVSYGSDKEDDNENTINENNHEPKNEEINIMNNNFNNNMNINNMINNNINNNYNNNEQNNYNNYNQNQLEENNEEFPQLKEIQIPKPNNNIMQGNINMDYDFQHQYVCAPVPVNDQSNNDNNNDMNNNNFNNNNFNDNNNNYGGYNNMNNNQINNNSNNYDNNSHLDDSIAFDKNYLENLNNNKKDGNNSDDDMYPSFDDIKH